MSRRIFESCQEPPGGPRAGIALAALCGLALAVLGAAACSGRDGGASKTLPKPRNLLIISIDTLRADRLGCYGYDRPTSPAIDALAKRGARFTTAISESSWTLPSHMTLMTGLVPTTHGVVTAQYTLSPKILTMADILHLEGFHAYAYAAGGLMSKRYGFAKGFDVYDDRGKHFDGTRRNMRETVELAKERLERDGGKAPWFLFLHTYDTHYPYENAEKYNEMFWRGKPEDEIDPDSLPEGADLHEWPVTPAQLQHLSDHYDAAIRSTDDALADLIAYMDGKKLFDDTLVILLSDHGEEFKEHGRLGHEKTLYIESLHVPLIVAGPGIRPREIDHPAGLVDIMPTVMEIFGAEPPPVVEGRSLVPLLAGNGAGFPDRPMYSELDWGVALRSVVDAGFHLIYDVRQESSEMYDLSRDPKEAADLAGSAPERAARLRGLIRSRLDGTALGTELLSEPLTEDEVEELRSLGYIR